MRPQRVYHLAQQVANLVDDGWEYPEAEWHVIKDLKIKPDPDELLDAYLQIGEE